MKAGKGYFRNNPGSEVIGSGAKPSNRKISREQPRPSTSYRNSKSKQNAGRAIDPQFAHTHGRCSACGSMMDGEVLAGLCGLCPPEKLREFVAKHRGQREGTRTAEQMDLL